MLFLTLEFDFSFKIVQKGAPSKAFKVISCDFCLCFDVLSIGTLTPYSHCVLAEFQGNVDGTAPGDQTAMKS